MQRTDQQIGKQLCSIVYITLCYMTVDMSNEYDMFNLNRFSHLTFLGKEGERNEMHM